METFLTIASKRDTREYAADDIPSAVVARILEAGRVSGSAMNHQERRFIVLTDTREQVSEFVTRPSNLLGCRLAVAVVTGSGAFADFDAGRAAQNMMLAAWSDGVASCPNAIADQAALEELLGIEEAERVATILSFGHPVRGRGPGDRSESEWLAAADRVDLEAITTTA